jgi:hypothetical protein
MRLSSSQRPRAQNYNMRRLAVFCVVVSVIAAVAETADEIGDFDFEAPDGDAFQDASLNLTVNERRVLQRVDPTFSEFDVSCSLRSL